MDFRGWWDDQSTDVKIIVALTALVIVPLVLIIAVNLTVGAVGIALSGGDTGATAPNVQIECTVEDETLTFRHAGGDILDPERLSVKSPDRAQITSMPEEQVQEGDEIVVSGTTSAELRWDPGNGNEPTVLHTCS